MTAWSPTIWKSNHQVFPPLHHMHAYNHNNHFGIAYQYLTHALFKEKHTHHIASLATSHESGKQEYLRKLLQGRDTNFWDKGNENEFERPLYNRIFKIWPTKNTTQVTGTMFPIRKHNLPDGKKFTYANFISNIFLQKK